MIYTCTLSPSLDYYMEFEDDFIPEERNRSAMEYYEAGGKGINVSIVLNNMMIPTRALGFLGGFTKDFYISLLQRYEYIQPSFVYIEGHTRINVKLGGKTNTQINAAGPHITHQSMQKLLKKMDSIYDDDFFIFSGFMPEYLEDQVVDMLKDLIDEEVNVVLDTNASLIRRMIPHHPYLIKFDEETLEAVYGQEADTREEMIALGKRCVEEGAQNVLIQIGSMGSFFISDLGVYYSNTDQSEVIVNAIGTGDAMVAGFVMNAQRSMDRLESFRFANCCKDATYFSKGLATREKVNEVYNHVQIVKVED